MTTDGVEQLDLEILTDVSVADKQEQSDIIVIRWYILNILDSQKIMETKNMIQPIMNVLAQLLGAQRA